MLLYTLKKKNFKNQKKTTWGQVLLDFFRWVLLGMFYWASFIGRVLLGGFYLAGFIG